MAQQEKLFLEILTVDLALHFMKIKNVEKKKAALHAHYGSLVSATSAAHAQISSVTIPFETGAVHRLFNMYVQCRFTLSFVQCQFEKREC